MAERLTHEAVEEVHPPGRASYDLNEVVELVIRQRLTRFRTTSMQISMRWISMAMEMSLNESFSFEMEK